MIELKDLIKVGEVGKSHGLKGEMNVAFDVDVDLEDVAFVVFDVDGIFVPFFIESYRFKNDMNALLLLEGVGDDVSARRFYRSEVYIHKDNAGCIMDDDEEGFNAKLFLGYVLVDESGKDIGRIDRVDDTTENVIYEVGEYLIPVAAIGVVDIDHDGLKIVVQLPEGLLDI